MLKTLQTISSEVARSSPAEPSFDGTRHFPNPEPIASEASTQFANADETPVIALSIAVVESSPLCTADWTVLGMGGSSVVYRGASRELGIPVAYKVLSLRDADLPGRTMLRLIRRFELEVRFLAQLKHDGIVRIFRTFVLDGRRVIEMEYLAGGNLTDAKGEVRKRGVRRVGQFMERVAGAVGSVHAKGIVHRDLKPGNILLNAEGEPCVTDFGIAKLMNPETPPRPVSLPATNDTPLMNVGTLTGQGPQPGTRRYMAPEQMNPRVGPITPATDVWALGLILQELLTPDPSDPRPMSGAVHRRLMQIAGKALQVQPRDRYVNGQELARAITVALKPSLRKLRWSATIVACGVAVGVLGASYGESAMTSVARFRGVNQLKDNESVAFNGRQLYDMARYPLGQEKGKARVVADGSVEAESGSSTGGLIEFLPELPKLPAQIDVELSHHALLNDSRESWAGFYVARTNLPTARGDGHALLYARFSDRGKSASPAPLAEIQIPDRKLHLTYSGILLPHDTAEVTKMNLRFIKPPLSKPVPTFVERGATRHIRFVLDDRGVTLSQVLDGNVAQVVGNLEWSTLREGQQRDIRTCGDDAVKVGTGLPTGGLGVYAYQAKVRVSGVTVTALSCDVLQR